MLREAKLLFVCKSNTLLTETMETLRCLLFPLSWSSCFVSRLPDFLLGLLEAPGGFMIGLHFELLSDQQMFQSNPDLNGDTFAMSDIQHLNYSHPMSPGNNIFLLIYLFFFFFNLSFRNIHC
jgi:hypothetical protein